MKQPVSFEGVKQIFFFEWDPIRVSGNFKLSDEYDRFVPEFVHLVNQGGSLERIVERLADAERTLFAETTEKTRTQVAESLLRLREGH
jgi:hypothetical protein